MVERVEDLATKLQGATFAKADRSNQREVERGKAGATEAVATLCAETVRGWLRKGRGVEPLLAWSALAAGDVRIADNVGALGTRGERVRVVGVCGDRERCGRVGAGHVADRPAAYGVSKNTVIQEGTVRAEGKFIDRGKDELMTNVIRGRTVVRSAIVVVRIRSTIGPERRSALEGVIKKLRVGISCVQVEPVAEPAADPHHSCVVVGVAVRGNDHGDVAKLRERTVPLRAMRRAKDCRIDLVDLLRCTRKFMGNTPETGYLQHKLRGETLLDVEIELGGVSGSFLRIEVAYGCCGSGSNRDSPKAVVERSAGVGDVGNPVDETEGSSDPIVRGIERLGEAVAQCGCVGLSRIKGVGEENTGASAKHRGAHAEGLIRKAKAGRKIVVVTVVGCRAITVDAEELDYTGSAGYRVNRRSVEAVHAVVLIFDRRVGLPAQAEVQREPRRDIPVVLQEARQIPAHTRDGFGLGSAEGSRKSNQKRSEAVPRACISRKSCWLRSKCEGS